MVERALLCSATTLLGTHSVENKRVACVEGNYREWSCSIRHILSEEEEDGFRIGATVNVECNDDTCVWDSVSFKGQVVVAGGWARLGSST